jgi:hypothetical protein
MRLFSSSSLQREHTLTLLGDFADKALLAGHGASSAVL